MKKVVLELGGSDPFLVLDDSDLDATVAAAVNNRMTNGGQACTASKRFIVVDDVYERFLDAFTEAMRRMVPATRPIPRRRSGRCPRPERSMSSPSRWRMRSPRARGC